MLNFFFNLNKIKKINLNKLKYSLLTLQQQQTYSNLKYTQIYSQFSLQLSSQQFHSQLLSKQFFHSQQQSQQQQTNLYDTTTIPLNLIKYENDLKLKIKDKLPLIEQDYVQIITLYKQHLLPKHAHRILIEMSENGFPPSISTYNEVLDAYAEAKQPHEAELFFNGLIENEIEISIVTYGTLLKAFAHSSLPHEAERILNDMISKQNLVRDILPNLHCYNIVIDGFAKLGLHQDAIRIYDSIPVSLKPTMATYGSVLSSYRNEPALGEIFFNQLLENNIIPNQICFTILISAYSKSGFPNDAERILDLMGKYHHVGPITYNLVINSYCKKLDLDSAHNLIKKMENQGLKPDLINYTTLLNGYCHSSKPYLAVEILEKLRLKKYKPNVVTYNTLIKVFVSINKPEEGEKLLDEMIRLSIQPDLVTFTILMNGYGKVNQIDSVLRIYNYIKNNKSYQLNDYIFNTLIKCYCKSNQTNEAEKILHEMIELSQKQSSHTNNNNNDHHKIKPDIVSFNTVLSGYNREKNLEACERVFKLLQSQNLQPDLITYTSLITAYGVNNQPEKAEKIFRQLIKAGIKPDNFIFHQLIQSYQKANRESDVRRITKEMELDNLESKKKKAKNSTFYR